MEGERVEIGREGKRKVKRVGKEENGRGRIAGEWREGGKWKQGEKREVEKEMIELLKVFSEEEYD